jgi:hypothetical protein
MSNSEPEPNDTDDFPLAGLSGGASYTKQAIDEHIKENWSITELQEKYRTLKAVTLENLPNLWPGLEFALSIKSILNIKGCSLPFAGILLGPASSQKTLIIECFSRFEEYILHGQL